MMALIFIIVFSVLAVSFAATFNSNMLKSDNYRRATEARMAAESGMSFAVGLMKDMQSEGSWSGTPDMLPLLYNHLAANLNGTANLTPNTVTLDNSASLVSVPAIDLDEDSSFSFVIQKVDGETLQLTVTGSANGLTRQLGMSFDVHEDKNILSYAVASRPRMIMRGNAQINGEICSTWVRTDVAGPFDIDFGSAGYVDGDIKTVLSEDEFLDQGGMDSIETEVQEQLGYDAPPISDYTTEDFDTSDILSWMESNNNKNTLPSTSDTQWEQFPEKATGTWFERPQYENETLDWTYIPENTHAHFKGCTFTGVTYIETNGTSKSTGNNIVFEDCTFEGPIVTNVPQSFQWKYNSLYFKGNTEFRPNQISQHLDGSTILAPNFNVNIGDFNKEGESSDSKITGILVGGIVDIRDNAVIEGTILSMANLDNISSGIQYYGTNLGYWEGDFEESGGSVPMSANITITPNPDSVLPLGIRKKYTISPNIGTYVEIK